MTITLPPGLYQEAKSRCNDTGLSLSTVIGDLLSTWMRGELSTPITQGDNERLTYLEERVKAISDKIESPIHTDTNQYAQDITDIRARLEALDNKQDNTPEVIHPHVENGEVVFDEDLRVYNQVYNRLQALKPGRTYKDIITMLGLTEDKESMLKKFKNGEPVKTMSFDDYNKIMNLSPSQKSSPEGT